MAKGIPYILQNIINKKKLEVRELYDSGKHLEYRKKAPHYPSTRNFSYAISNPGMNLIAEFKISSPSKGKIRPGANLEEIVKLYEESGASAISVLTDSHFDGEIGFLKRAADVANIPILRKDFIIDPIQIYESRVFGADAILLISALLEPYQINEYIGIARSLGMDCLVESHDLDELRNAMKGNTRIYGINNRNLKDFKVNRDTTPKLLKHVIPGCPVVAESGISSYDHVKELSKLGINTMLVGEAIMSAEKNPTLEAMKNKIDELLNN